MQYMKTIIHLSFHNLQSKNKIIEEKSECEEALKDDFNFLGGKMMKLYCEEDLEVLNMVIDIIDQIEGEENGKIN